MQRTYKEGELPSRIIPHDTTSQQASIVPANEARPDSSCPTERGVGSRVANGVIWGAPSPPWGGLG